MESFTVRWCFSAVLLFGLIAACLPALADDAGPVDAWPAVTREARPWAYWWWMGSAVNKEDLTRLFEVYREAEMGGCHIIPIYGAKGYEEQFIEYLSPKWMEMLAHSVSEAKRFDLGIDMTTGTGWCFGGPTVGDPDADAAVVHQAIPVAPGESLQERFDPQGTQALVAYSKTGEVVELTDKIGSDGAVAWVAPAGEWTVHAVSQKPSSRRVKRAAPGGEGYMLNPFYRDAMTRYLERFAKAFDAYGGPVPRAMYHDSYEYSTNWGSDLFEQFERRRGYRLQAHLPALFGEGPADVVGRVKADWRRTVSEIITDDYIGRWDAWVNARGMRTRNQAHGSPGNLLDLYAAADIPETEMFNKDRDPLVAKFASSAAHVAGKPLVGAEFGTWLKEHFTVTLADLKYLGDDLLVSGVNHLIYHGNAYSPAEAPWPGWCFYASTQMNPRNSIWRDAPALNRYFARIQAVLQANRPANDILLYWPIHDLWHQPEGMQQHLTVHHTSWLVDYPLGRLARHLWKRGYTFDYVSDRQLAKAAAEEGCIRVPGGTYQVVLVPETGHMPVSTFEKLLNLAREGATVVFEKGLPRDVPGLAKLDDRRPRLAELKNSLRARPVAEEAVPAFVEAKHGKGTVLIGDADAALVRAGIGRETMVDYEGILFIRTRNQDRVDYFIANRGETPFDGRLPLRAEAESVLLMDPLSGRIGKATSARTDEGTQVRLALKPGESMIVRALSNETADTPPWPYWKTVGEPLPLCGTWQVEFIEGGPELPGPFETDKLESWTALGGKEAQAFAGTARYRLVFDAPPGDAKVWRLDLGRVAESAGVRLNGKDLGTLLAPPFDVIVEGLNPQGNVLEVEVTNLSANRIRDLDIRKVQWRVFYDINLVNIDYRPFDASTWPVRESGLLGPVTVQGVE